jgi:hypothetical protein
MITINNRKYWFAWLFATLCLGAYFSAVLFWGNDKQVLMPGQLSGGHHQIGIDCEACHPRSFNNQQDIQEACESCHGETREKPFDSHPKAKFTDPRNANLLAKLDVLKCITCHSEHHPEIVHKGGFTQPRDFCIHCHADIGDERPTHKDLDFMSCNNAGCHNFHNNRALYTDFIAKHLEDPDHLEKQQLPLRDYVQHLEEMPNYPRDRYPVKVLGSQDIDAPLKQRKDKQITADWLATSHARSGVNCNACHMSQVTKNVAKDEISKKQVWHNKPDRKVCAQCHETEIKHFQEGKHGMRLKLGLSPMTPAQARLPMNAKHNDKILDCMTCHTAHRFDLKKAAVESCLECHTDKHSLAYKDSPHYKLWQDEVAGKLPEGSGVSCASCHMPRIDMDVNDWMSRVVVQHNQNASLVPNEKMLRPACLHCHGLEFSINSLADEVLIQHNFKGQPSFQTKSLRFTKEHN